MAKVHVIPLSCMLSNACFVKAHTVIHVHHEGEHGVTVIA